MTIKSKTVADMTDHATREAIMADRPLTWLDSWEADVERFRHAVSVALSPLAERLASDMLRFGRAVGRIRVKV